ncbi:MAG: DUF2076 family protein [Rhodospirillales bacterium]|nr:DUF2076 family protein [Rhodospirillales bacterium]
MTNEERDLITRFVERVGGPPAGGSFAGSVPATTGLPPIDAAADALLAELFQRFPQARYRVTQYAFAQEHALAEAQNTIRQLQAQLAQARAQAPMQAQPAPSPWGAAAPHGYPPQPPYPATQQPGMAPQQGAGFLGSALRTAAGVAGGIFAADALMGLFGGHGGFGGGLLGGGNGPWSGGADADDQGGWTDAAGGPGGDPGLDAGADPGGFDGDPNSI